ncbi:DUF4276 family protein [Xanthomonas sp. SHU 166]|uniref:DUF4276 family protein n=1 Tax=Xanthomonas sp. SHU 166 TaxID=1591170 RepID=UPI0012FF4E3C|nr:DUF4276 family protein [Xanthomonas sp. SHU 166]
MRPAYLVDGITEQRFVQAICQGSPVRLTNLNGNSVSAEAIAKRIASIVRLWKGRHYPIIVVVDLEKRSLSADEFARQVEESVKAQGIEDLLIVGAVDRMIENWMICDEAVWGEGQLRELTDGFSGATELKRMMPTYDKAADGPTLLIESRASEIAKRSKSFKVFCEKLQGLKCNWLNR